MTTEKLVRVLTFYREHLGAAYGAVPAECPDDPSAWAHLAWMCERAAGPFVAAGAVAKAMRWLGYVQGCLLCRGAFTLAELRAHSRPEGVAVLEDDGHPD
jgi:hypothetical protein